MINARAWERASFWLLAALLVFLPTIEVPKTVAALLFIIVSWLGPSSRKAGRRPDAFGWALLGVVGASLVSTAVNWPFPNGAKGLYDTALYAAVGWGVYRRGWTEGELKRLVAAGVVGVFAGLVRGGFDVFRGREVALELYTMTSPTSSAIYLGIILTLAVSLVVLDLGRKWWWWAASSVLLVGLFLMGSRGGILAVAIAGCVWLIMVRPPRIWIPVAAVATSVALVAALPNIFAQDRAFAKIAALITTGRMDANDNVRMTMWKLGVAEVVHGDSLWFGVGPKNFSSLDSSRMGRPREAIGYPIEHAHNLFLNKAVEEGLMGLTAMLALFGVVAHRLAREVIAARARHWRSGAAWGALAVPIVAGSFNTPWSQEHALLAMIWFGIYLGLSAGDSSHDNGERSGPKSAEHRVGPRSRVLIDSPT
jgi:O-antigen ligase